MEETWLNYNAIEQWDIIQKIKIFDDRKHFTI